MDVQPQFPGGCLAELHHKFLHILMQDIYIRTLGNSNDFVFLSWNFEAQNKYFKTSQLLVIANMLSGNPEQTVRFGSVITLTKHPN